MAAAPARLPRRWPNATAAWPPARSPQSVIAALQRHFLRLQRMRGALDGGRSMDDVMRSLRPPPHFKQRAEIEQQARS
jgi:DNA polymerase-3 subunit delta